jgi:hypothetical protein
MHGERYLIAQNHGEPGVTERNSFDIEHIRERLRFMRQALEAPETSLLKAARENRLPDEIPLPPEQERRQEDAEEPLSVEARIAAEIVAFSVAVDLEKTAFELRELPRRAERLLGYVSKAAMRKLVERRWARRASLTRLGELLRRGDMLCGLLTDERDFLLAKRKSFEGGLVQFIDHRQEIVERTLAADANADGPQAASAVEDFIRATEGLVQTLNRRLADCNALLHKLALDTENLLILCRVVIEVDQARGKLDIGADEFPHLGSALERFRSGMLIGPDLERLRQDIDGRFFGRFAGHGAHTAGVEPPVAGQA